MKTFNQTLFSQSVVTYSVMEKTRELFTLPGLSVRTQLECFRIELAVRKRFKWIIKIIGYNTKKVPPFLVREPINGPKHENIFSEVF